MDRKRQHERHSSDKSTRASNRPAKASRWMGQQWECETILETLFNCSPSGIIIIDPDLFIRAANEEFAQLVRCPLDQIVHRHVEEIVPGWIENAGHIFQNVRRTGQTYRSEAYPFTFPNQPQRGLTYWDGTLAPIRDVKGTFQGWLLMLREVTERERAEEEIRRSHAILAEAESLAHLGSYEFDVRSGEDTWSDEMYRITGLDPAQGPPSFEEFVNKIVHPDDRERLIKLTENMVAGKEPIDTEFRIITPSGHLKYLLSRGQPEENDAGVVIGFYGANQDITERQRAEQERERFITRNAASSHGAGRDTGFNRRGTDHLRAAAGTPPHEPGSGKTDRLQRRGMATDDGS